MYSNTLPPPSLLSTVIPVSLHDDRNVLVIVAARVCTKNNNRKKEKQSVRGKKGKLTAEKEEQKKSLRIVAFLVFVIIF